MDVDQQDAFRQRVDDLLETVAGSLGLGPGRLLLDKLQALGLGALLGRDVSRYQHEAGREAVGARRDLIPARTHEKARLPAGFFLVRDEGGAQPKS